MRLRPVATADLKILRVRHVLEDPRGPGHAEVERRVEDLHAGDEPVGERRVERIIVERAFHEVQEAAAHEPLEAERLLLVADPDVADDGDLPETDPHVRWCGRCLPRGC